MSSFLPRQSGRSESDGFASPPLEVSECMERCMGNAAVATRILESFERQLQGDFEAIHTAIVAVDAPSLAGTAHSLKGAAGAVGARRLNSLAAEIEGLARAGDLGQCQTRLIKLDFEMQSCLAYLPEARQHLQAASAASPSRAAPATGSEGAS